MAKEGKTQKGVMPTADGLAASASAASGRRLPPVHLWNPPYCGEIAMEIRRDGTWFYEGTPIGRPALVRLFSTILKREGDRIYLVTPVEKVGIRVEDAPFVAVDSTSDGDALVFETNVGDRVRAGPDHPIRVERAPDGEPSPYIHVRGGLEALIDRKTFYRLVKHAEHAEHEGECWFGLRSAGTFFPLIPSAELPD
ncbi:DUF1285 domain-containing protein [Roseitranquillus sediminis]|uniref:DUF1285 domain-containing protein n=1 Tax=Roseitranquillus sediminis TaxID=2809051 RepID=UPI001D0C6CB0|nr:DUF1285 domain-containing protein [Roseitranquillus sediminis]MBM9594842.1 DUF1285 domain-containing protein [Roseitranquillus sediminis]